MINRGRGGRLTVGCPVVVSPPPREWSCLYRRSPPHKCFPRGERFISPSTQPQPHPNTAPPPPSTQTFPLPPAAMPVRRSAPHASSTPASAYSAILSATAATRFFPRAPKTAPSQ